MTTQSGQILRSTRAVDSTAEWSGFVAAVYAIESVERGTWDRARRDLPSFRNWGYEPFWSPGVSHMVRDAIAHRRQPDAEYFEACRAWAVLRAEQGIPVDEAVKVFHLYRTELNRRAARMAPNILQAPKLVLLSELLAEWLDAGLLAVLRAHGGTQAPADTVDHRAAQLVRSVLLDGSGAAAAPGEFERYGLNSSRRFYAVRARPTPEHTPAGIAQYLCSGGPGLTTCINGDVCGIVEHLPPTPAPVPIGVTGPVGLSAVANAFLRASRAHETSVAFGLHGQQSLDSLGLYPSVLSDNEVGDVLVARYIEPVARLGASGRAILATVARYLESDYGLAETAKSDFLHVNTVRYRLRKFEEITGRSLKSAEVHSEVWWAFARRRVVHGERPAMDASALPEDTAEVVPLHP
ncbi:PucR family transcriptional regulator [Streptomyces sp. cg40]|uniref:PucR family transcriptional regulator n=1 Tax=Streptomyces sp. cg40 TaxID=3419764 RepID=UPI003D0400C8